MSLHDFSLPVPSLRARLTTVVIAVLLAVPPASAQSLTATTATKADSPCPACRDFYSWANRAWLDTASIPAASAEWGTWSANDARVTAQLHATLQAAASTPPAKATFADRTLGLLYTSCMDSARANSDGIAPLANELAAINDMRTREDLARTLARLHRQGVSAAFTFSSEVDRTNDLHFAGTLDTPRLPLGTRAYSATDSTSNERLASYRAHVSRTFVLAGESDSQAHRDADAVIAIESGLAAATPSMDDDMTVADMFRHLSLSRLEHDAPGFAWTTYLRARRVPDVKHMDSLIVQAPAYFTGVARLASERPMSEWRAYLRWRLLATNAPFLSDPFVREDFDWARRSSGVTAMTPRWDRCAREIGADVPELLGRAYAARNFPPSSKARIDSMVTQIRAVLVERIATVPWLTEPTRKLALEKARRFGVKIGYPDRWHDVSAMRVTPGAFVTQRAAAQRFESDRMALRIGRVPDRAEWDYHSFYRFVPQSPTAWANWDEIIFPAAYLQPPIYDPAATVADNFGSLGVIIGHEMTHLFTADGGDVDSYGRVRHWWTPTDSARFADVQGRMIRQFDGYTVLDSATHVSGSRTLSENLADLGGIELAFAAMQRTLARQPRAVVAAGDTTAAMRFFISYARMRVAKYRDERLRQVVKTDWHAPAMWRVNGALSDFAGFAATFGCETGTPMVRADSLRVRIW